MKPLDRLKTSLRGLGRMIMKFSRADYIRDWYAGNDVNDSLRRNVLGSDINESTALSIGTVYACALIIAETLSTLDLNLQIKTSKRTTLADGVPEFYLFRNGQPNPNCTTVDFLETFIVSTILNGNGYAYMNRSRGRVTELWNIHPRAISTITRYGYDLVYNWMPTPGETPFGPEQQKLVQGYDALHFRRFSRNGVTGMSVLGAFKESMGLALAQEEFQTNLYLNGVMNKGTLQTDAPLDVQQLSDLSEMLKEQYAGVRNSGTALILPYGLKWNSITMTPEDAQMIEQFKFTEQQIAKVFRVPLYKLQNHDSSTFSNVEHLAIEFVQDCIRPWAVRLEQCLNHQVLTQTQLNAGLEFKFDLDQLLRGATIDRFTAHQIAINSGFKTRNEVRLEEDLDPKPGLDEILMPLNMVPQSDYEAQQEAAQAANDANNQQNDSKDGADQSQNDQKQQDQGKDQQKESNSRAILALRALNNENVRRFATRVLKEAAKQKPTDHAEFIERFSSYLDNLCVKTFMLLHQCEGRFDNDAMIVFVWDKQKEAIKYSLRSLVHAMAVNENADIERYINTVIDDAEQFLEESVSAWSGVKKND